MRVYTPSPEVSTSEDVPKFTITVNDMVCSTDAYTLKVPSKENRYIAAVTITMTDEECDLLTEVLAEARTKRLMQQEQAYEKLHAKFAGDWDNDAVEAEVEDEIEDEA
jgi:metal-sulfur cluster biosynthetic enzyme